MARTDYFLKIDGIQGESEDSQKPNEIQLINWQWTEAQKGTSDYGGGAGAGKVRADDFEFTMKTSKASPLLMQACADGRMIPKAVLTCRKPTGQGGQKDYLKYTFSDVLISFYHISGEPGDDGIPTDRVGFNFAKLEVQYKPQGRDGAPGAPVDAGYDFKAMKKA